MSNTVKTNEPLSYPCPTCGRNVVKIRKGMGGFDLVYNAPPQPYWRTSSPDGSVVTVDGTTIYGSLYGHDDPKTADGLGYTLHTCLIATTREQELVISIADFLDNWVEEEDGEEWTRNIPFDVSIRFIEKYGVEFINSCDALVVNAIRHYMDIVNPWVRDASCDTFKEMCGFTEEECAKYYGLWSQGNF